MPQFYPEHTPEGLDAFTREYLAAAEWLLDEDVDRAEVRGFSDAAIARAVEDCTGFQTENATDLAAWTMARPGDAGGHDFWLTRNGHGAGFRDRGLGDLGERLANGCESFEDVDTYVEGRLIEFE